MSRQYRVWIDHLTRTLHECMPLEESYVLLHSSNMVGLFTCVFVKHKERHNIKNINASEIKRGMGGLHGNKVCGGFAFEGADTAKANRTFRALLSSASSLTIARCALSIAI